MLEEAVMDEEGLFHQHLGQLLVFRLGGCSGGAGLLGGVKGRKSVSAAP